MSDKKFELQEQAGPIPPTSPATAPRSHNPWRLSPWNASHDTHILTFCISQALWAATQEEAQQHFAAGKSKEMLDRIEAKAQQDREDAQKAQAEFESRMRRESLKGKAAWAMAHDSTQNIAQNRLWDEASHAAEMAAQERRDVELAKEQAAHGAGMYKKYIQDTTQAGRAALPDDSKEEATLTIQRVYRGMLGRLEAARVGRVRKAELEARRAQEKVEEMEEEMEEKEKELREESAMTGREMARLALSRQKQAHHPSPPSHHCM